MTKPKMMRPAPSAPAGLEQDSHGRPIPLKKRTKEDQEETLTRRNGAAARALCLCGHRHDQHDKHAPYLCEKKGCVCDGFSPRDEAAAG